MQSVRIYLGGVAVVRDGAHHRAHIAREGLAVLFFLVGKVHIERLFHLFHRRKPDDMPLVVGDLFDRIFRLFVLVRHVADQQFEQVVDRDDAAHAAVFVQHDHHMLFGVLHAVEQFVRGHVFGHEDRLLDRLFHDVFARLVFEAEVDLGVEYAEHVVGVLAADGVIDVAAAVDRLFPLGVVLAGEHDVDVFAVGADLAGGVVLEVEDVLDEFALLLVDLSLFAARFRHEDDVLFCDGVVVLVLFDAEYTQHGVGRHCQQPHKRSEDDRHDFEHAGYAERIFFRPLHRDAFGDELAERDVEEREHDRDKDDAHRIDRGDTG